MCVCVCVCVNQLNPLALPGELGQRLCRPFLQYLLCNCRNLCMQLLWGCCRIAFVPIAWLLCAESVEDFAHFALHFHFFISAIGNEFEISQYSSSERIVILRTVLHRIHRVPAAPRAWNADRRQHQAGVVPDRVHNTSRSRVLWPPNMPHPSRHSDRKWLLCPPVDRS